MMIKYIIANPIVLFNPQEVGNSLDLNCTLHLGIESSLVGTDPFICNELENQACMHFSPVSHHPKYNNSLLVYVINEPGFTIHT